MRRVVLGSSSSAEGSTRILARALWHQRLSEPTFVASSSVERQAQQRSARVRGRGGVAYRPQAEAKARPRRRRSAAAVTQGGNEEPWCPWYSWSWSRSCRRRRHRRTITPQAETEAEPQALSPLEALEAQSKGLSTRCRRRRIRPVSAGGCDIIKSRRRGTICTGEGNANVRC